MMILDDMVLFGDHIVGVVKMRRDTLIRPDDSIDYGVHCIPLPAQDIAEDILYFIYWTSDSSSEVLMVWWNHCR